MELTVASLFDLTWLVFAIGTLHHGSKTKFWVSWLGFNTYNMALGLQCMREALVCTKIEI